MARVYNFSAGPSMLPEQVLKQAQAELLDYQGSGQSVMEMSHRSKWFEAIIQDTEDTLRRVMQIPDNYKVGFFQGGATQQFAMVPLNFMTTGKADYIVTGNFSNLAAKEAAKFGQARVIASSKDKNFTYIPDVAALPYDADASYIHICQNNTIFGTQYVELPQVEGALGGRYEFHDPLEAGGGQPVWLHLFWRTEKCSACRYGHCHHSGGSAGPCSRHGAYDDELHDPYREG